MQRLAFGAKCGRDGKPPPDFGGAIDTEFLKGLATLDEKLVVLLDIDKLLNAEQLSHVGKAVSVSPSQSTAAESTSAAPSPPPAATDSAAPAEH